MNFQFSRDRDVSCLNTFYVARKYDFACLVLVSLF